MPTTPAPREVNDVLIIGIGTLIWLIALLVSAIINPTSRATGVCLAGFGLGLWGLRYVRRRTRR